MNADSTPAATAAPKTRRGQASRDRLVDAAVTSVLDHGIHQMRVDEVLAAAGSSKSQMYHYFADRDALVEAVVERRCGEFTDQLALAFGVVESLDSLAAVLRGFAADYAKQLSGCPIGSLASELIGGPDPARRVTVVAFAAWEGFLADALARLRAAGELPPSTDTGELALAVLASLEGGMFLSQVRGDARPLDAAVASSLAHLRGLAP